MVFEGFHFCHRFSFGVEEVVLGVILQPFGDLWVIFFDFLKDWKDIGILRDLAWFPETS